MGHNDLAISVRGLCKEYVIAHEEKNMTLGEKVMARLQKPLHRAPTERFQALNDVSFDVKKGDVVGIIGRNGAGKSTLLKILSRITEPTSGEIKLYGRVASLLEVGTGFHPELTGRENIYLNGAILGMKRPEIRKHFDAIVAFAEIEKFLDTPVKRYSSGMYVRLAFAVAAHLNPEILIVDEVLAVGDAQFQAKCLGKMKEISQGGGRTVLFVSHNIAAIRTLCSSGVLLSTGVLKCSGTAAQCVSQYLDHTSTRTSTILACGKAQDSTVKVAHISVNGSEAGALEIGIENTTLTIAVKGIATQRVRLDIEGQLRDSSGGIVGQFSPTRLHGNLQAIDPGSFSLETSVVLPKLNKGTYNLDIWLTEPMVKGFWEFNQCLRIYSCGNPLRNGAVLNSSESGSILLLGETRYF